jgi:hypothetical protein
MGEVGGDVHVVTERFEVLLLLRDLLSQIGELLHLAAADLHVLGSLLAGLEALSDARVSFCLSSSSLGFLSLPSLGEAMRRCWRLRTRLEDLGGT